MRNSMSPVCDATVFIIHPDPSIRRSVTRLCHSINLPVSPHATALNFLGTLDGQPVGCLVTGLQLPDAGGLELLDHLQRQESTLPAIIIADRADVSTVVQAFRRGVKDIFHGGFSEQELMASILAAVKESRERCRRHRQRQHIRASLNLLSEREYEVLQHLLRGQPNKQIAHELNVSEKTVATHRANILAKMGVDSLVGLVQILLPHLTDSELSDLV